MHLRISFALLAGLWLSEPAKAEWDTYQNDPGHTGFVPATLNASQFSLAWQRQLAATNLTGMAIGSGNVFVSNGSVQALFNGTTSFFALNEQTGTVAWTKAFSSTNSGWPLVFSVNAPAYSGGNVYLQTSNNSDGTFLYSFNAATGATNYVAPFTSQWETYLAPTPYGGNIYMDGGTYGGMYSFSGSSGSENWFNYSLPQFDAWTPAVTATTAYGYISGAVFALNRTTGAEQYFINDPNAVPTYYSMNESIVLGSANDAFITNNGRLVSYSLLSDATHTPHIQWVDTDHFTGQVTVAQDILYCADGSLLEALTETSGVASWNWTPPDGNAITGPMIATNNELFLSTDADVYAVNLLTHQTDWSMAESGNLALSDGMLFVSSPNGLVAAVNLPEPIIALPAIFLLLGIRRRRKNA